MKLTLSWLKDHLDSDADAAAIAEKLTNIGLEVEYMDQPEFKAFWDADAARLAQVLSALELGRRAQRVTERRPRLRTPKEIHTYLFPSLSALRREVFHVLCFNPRNVLLADVPAIVGSIDIVMGEVDR